MSGTDTPSPAFKASHRVAIFFLSLCGIGFIPLSEGTVASAVAILPAWLLSASTLTAQWQLGILIGVLAILSVISHKIIVSLSPDLGGNVDQGWIVMDEVVGMGVALTPIIATGTWNWWLVSGAFVAFRILDIWKPLFIGRIDAWNTPASVLLDDIAGGAIGALLITALLIA